MKRNENFKISKMSCFTRSVADPNPHQNGKLDTDTDPHQSERQRPEPDQNPNPHPHPCEKVKALEGHLGPFEGPNLGKSEW
jgi:hypothetical protein